MSEELTLDAGRMTLTWGKHTLRLTKQSFALLAVLSRSPERFVSAERLTAAIWLGADTCEKSLPVLVHKVRRMLAEAGCPLRITTGYGAGYALDRTLLVSPEPTTVSFDIRSVRLLRELLETHPNAGLVERAYGALGLA